MTPAELEDVKKFIYNAACPGAFTVWEQAWLGKTRVRERLKNAAFDLR
jgi:hypothetical protein